MRLENPEQLTSIIESLTLDSAQKLELNRKLANRTRQFFRQQINKQRDIDNVPYHSRAPVRRRTRTRTENREVINTKDGRNMMMGISRSLKTNISDSAFSVGVTGVLARIARDHNEGRTLTFTTRMNGFYDSRTNQWKGGVRTKNNYRMPKRTFIGWTPSLERELMGMISAELLKNVET